jgi:hypothetical protein
MLQVVEKLLCVSCYLHGTLNICALTGYLGVADFGDVLKRRVHNLILCLWYLLVKALPSPAMTLNTVYLALQPLWTLAAFSVS